MMGAAPTIAEPEVSTLYVIGTQRAGTTWLHKMLARKVDEVLVQPQKEVDFWTTHMGPRFEKYRRRARLKYTRAAIRSCLGLRPGLRDEFRLRRLHHRALSAPLPKALAYYRAFLTHGLDDQSVVVDVSPSYALLSGDHYRKMLAAAEEARMLVLLRDPVERAVSAVNYFSDGAAMGQNGLDQLFRDFLRDEDPYGDYARILGALRDHVTPDRWKALFYEDVVTLVAADELADFIGVPEFRGDATDRVNTGARVMRPSPALYRAAVRRYEQTYAFCHAFFDGALPTAWRQNMAILGEGQR